VCVELQRRPELRGLPVVVAGSGPRAVVTTASYEARRFGIFSATPAERARRLCPEAVFVAPDFDHYRRRSKDLMAVIKGEVELVEVVGLDEAYLDLSELDRPRAAALKLKATVRDRTGLVCSIGIGPNKLVAKVASDADKPDGFLVLTREQACERFADASPRLIPGIGPKTVTRLAARGVDTLAKLREVPEKRLVDSFGANQGCHLARLARFEDERALETVRVAKSESCETTFDYDLRGLDALEPELERLSARLCEGLARQERSGRTVAIKVRFDDFSTVTRARTLDGPVNDLETVLSVARELLRQLAPERPVRLLGVRVAGLDEGRRAMPAGPPQGQLDLAV
jgi:DNA polymerase-4